MLRKLAHIFGTIAENEENTEAGTPAISTVEETQKQVIATGVAGSIFVFLKKVHSLIS